MFSLSCSLAKFVSRYAHGVESQGNPFTHTPELAEGSSEWQRQLTFLAADKAPIRMLGNPEHVRACEGRHGEHEICEHCQVPVCLECYTSLLPHCAKGIPMALCNDNFWGYTTDIIYKYKVRWIEAAIVSPCWTSMIVYYAEGGYGHLMTQSLAGQENRTLVKGTCFSFHMPWEDMLQDL